MATPPLPPAPPPPTDPTSTPTLLALDADGLLKLINDQTKKDRDAFDRLLKWFGGGATLLTVMCGALLTFFNWKTREQVTNDLRDETRKQLKALVDQELTTENINAQIERALRQKTDVQFQQAINKAVASELSTSERQKAIEAAIHRQIDALTKRLSQRQNIATLETGLSVTHFKVELLLRDLGRF